MATADMQGVLKEVEAKMISALDALGREFAAVRTGRASAGLLEGIRDLGDAWRKILRIRQQIEKVGCR